MVFTAMEPKDFISVTLPMVEIIRHMIKGATTSCSRRIMMVPRNSNMEAPGPIISPTIIPKTNPIMIRWNNGIFLYNDIS